VVKRFVAAVFCKGAVAWAEEKSLQFATYFVHIPSSTDAINFRAEAAEAAEKESRQMIEYVAERK
jgi:hypothetical protein